MIRQTTIRQTTIRQLCFTASFLCCFHLMTAFATGQELLIRYTFDEESGIARDTGSGVSSDGILGPGAMRIDDTPGDASPFALDLREPGDSVFVNGGDSVEVDTLESFTLTTWLYLEGLNADQGGSGNVRLIAKQGPAPDFNGFSWNLNGPNAGERGPDNFRTGLFIGGEEGFAFAFAAEDAFADEWAFLAVTYDGTQLDENVGFYYGDEGTEVYLLDDFFEDLAAGPVASTAGEADFGIGFTDAAPGVDFAAVGFQDDVRVYDGVLTLEQLEEVRLENLVFEGPVCDPNSGGDLDENGEVDFADFLILSGNFGMQTDTHLDGDINCNGEVDFPDFLALSANFGTAVAAANVPEPSAAWMSLMATMLLGLIRVRRGHAAR